MNYQPGKLKNRNKNLSVSSKTNNRIIMNIVARFANLKVRKMCGGKSEVFLPIQILILSI